MPRYRTVRVLPDLERRRPVERIPPLDIPRSMASRNTPEVMNPDRAINVITREAQHGWWTDAAFMGQRFPPANYLSANVNGTPPIVAPVIGEPITAPIKADEIGPPKVRTLTLGLSSQPTPFADSFNHVQAYIQAGIGGGQQNFTVDWLDGTQISLPFNTMKVTPVFVGPAGAGSLSTDTTFIVTLGDGPAGTKRGAQLTLDANGDFDFVHTVLAGGSTPEIRLPPFTRAVRMHVTNATLGYVATTLFNFLERPGVVISSVNGAQLANAGGPVAVPIPNQAKFVQVANGSASNIFVVLVSELDL